VGPLDPEEVLCVASSSNAVHPAPAAPISSPYPVTYLSPALSHRPGAAETWAEVQFRFQAEAAAAMSARYASPLLSPLSSYRSACPICLKFFHEFPTSTLPCGHTYHTECIRRWLVINATCPYCRMEVSPPSTPSRSPKIIVELASPTHTARPFIVDRPPATYRDFPVPALPAAPMALPPFLPMTEAPSSNFAISPAISPEPGAPMYSLFPQQCFGTATQIPASASAISHTYNPAESPKSYPYGYQYHYLPSTANLPSSTTSWTPYGTTPVPVSEYQPRTSYYIPQYLPPQVSTTSLTSYQAPAAAATPAAPQRPSESPIPTTTYWFPAGHTHSAPYYTTTTTTTTTTYPPGYQFGSDSVFSTSGAARGPHPLTSGSIPCPGVPYPSLLPAMAPPVTIAPRFDSPPATVNWLFPPAPGWPPSVYHQLPFAGFRNPH